MHAIALQIAQKAQPLAQFDCGLCLFCTMACCQGTQLREDSQIIQHAVNQ